MSTTSSPDATVEIAPPSLPEPHTREYLGRRQSKYRLLYKEDQMVEIHKQGFLEGAGQNAGKVSELAALVHLLTHALLEKDPSDLTVARAVAHLDQSGLGEPEQFSLHPQSLKGPWQPIESAPKDGSRFLAVLDGKVHFFHWQGPERSAFVGWRDSFITVYPEGSGPKYWMHIPPVPMLEAAGIQ